jgi:hypothetical protein
MVAANLGLGGGGGGGGGVDGGATLKKLTICPDGRRGDGTMPCHAHLQKNSTNCSTPGNKTREPWRSRFLSSSGKLNWPILEDGAAAAV